MKFHENMASITDALFNFIINSLPNFRDRLHYLCWRFYSKIKNTTMTKCDLENCVLLRYYTGGSGNSLTTLRDNLSVPSSKVKKKKKKTGFLTLEYPKRYESLTLEFGTNRLYRNVGKELRVMTQKSTVLIYFAAESLDHAKYDLVIRRNSAKFHF